MKTSDAIKVFGSPDALAKALGIDRTAIYHWGESVPPLRQFQLQVITAGALVAAKDAPKVAANRTAA